MIDPRATTGWCLVVAIAGGCHHAKPSKRAWHPDPTVAAGQLDRLVDQAGQKMAAELPRVTEVTHADRKLVLAAGEIENGTTTDTAAFEAAMRRLMSDLSDAKSVTNNFALVPTGYDAAKGVMRAVQPGGREFDDPLSDARSHDEPVKYDPTIVYVLNGRFFVQRDGDDRAALTLLVQVEHAARRKAVWSTAQRIDLQWNRVTSGWEELPK